MLELVETVTQSLNGHRPTGPIIRLDDRGVKAMVGRCGVKTRGEAVQKPTECRLDLHANDRVMWAGHPDVGEICGAFGKNAFIRSLHVGVSADDGGDPAVQMP